MRGDVQKVRLRAFEGGDLRAEGDAIEAGADAGRVLVQPDDLVVAEHRAEAAGDDHHRAGALPQVQRADDGGAFPPRSVIVVRRGPQEVRPILQCRGIVDAHPTRRQDGTVRVQDECRLASDKSLGPHQRPVGEGGAVVGVQQEGMEGVTELVLLGLAPDAADESRWKEGHVQHRHDAQGHDVEQEADHRAQSAGDRPDDDDEKQPTVARAERAETSLLDRGAPARSEPERDDGLEDAVGPNSDDGDDHQRLEWRVGSVRVGGDLEHQGEEPDQGNGRGEQPGRERAERHEGVSEHQEAVARGEEQDQREVGQELPCGPIAVERRREEDQDGQGAQRDGQVGMAPVRVLDPADDRPDGKEGEGGFDGHLEDEENFGHLRHSSLPDDLLRTRWFGHAVGYPTNRG